MKTKIYFGNNPSQFAPCNITSVILDQSIKMHPIISGIRNKRKRMREVKKLNRIGIYSFVRAGWEIEKP